MRDSRTFTNIVQVITRTARTRLASLSFSLSRSRYVKSRAIRSREPSRMQQGAVGPIYVLTRVAVCVGNARAVLCTEPQARVAGTVPARSADHGDIQRRGDFQGAVRAAGALPKAPRAGRVCGACPPDAVACGLSRDPDPRENVQSAGGAVERARDAQGAPFIVCAGHCRQMRLRTWWCPCGLVCVFDQIRLSADRIKKNLWSEKGEHHT